MKLALSTDFGGEHHWQRLVEFARSHGVERLVFWGAYSAAHFTPPWLYPAHQALLEPEQRRIAQTVRGRMARAAQLAGAAGLEFWYCYQVLMLPPPEHVRTVCPDLFNEPGEPDMAGEFVYGLLRQQLEELAEIAPGLAGLETWIMECASIRIAHLRHQTLSTGEIIERIVETVHAFCRERGWRLDLDLHTAGGDRATLDGIFAAAARRPDVIVSGDNVVGDFQLRLPFNDHLRRAARSNPVQVHFDLNGEYWGRNFVPTCALAQYAEHLEEARRLGAECVNGRVSTGHDRWSPHDNLLPSRRRFYPALAEVKPGEPLPDNIEVCCTDTLGGMNAEFFCRRACDPAAQPEQAVRELLCDEFGPGAEALVGVFLRLEDVLARLFCVGRNYFVAQSVAQSPYLVPFWGLDFYMTSPAGTPFPTPEVLARRDQANVAAFSGWPTPLDHRTEGPAALIAEKVEALAAAKAMLAEVQQACEGVRPEDRDFLVGRFEDLVLFARAYRWLLEAQVHHFMLRGGVSVEGLPDRERLGAAQEQMRAVASDWVARYAADRYGLSALLNSWLSEMGTP